MGGDARWEGRSAQPMDAASRPWKGLMGRSGTKWRWHLPQRAPALTRHRHSASPSHPSSWPLQRRAAAARRTGGGTVQHVCPADLSTEVTEVTSELSPTYSTI